MSLVGTDNVSVCCVFNSVANVTSCILIFSRLLCLWFVQDKWRNINVTAIWGSRQKAKLALKRNLSTPKHDNNPLAVSSVLQNDEEIVDAKPLTNSGGTLRNTNSKEPNAR